MLTEAPVCSDPISLYSVFDHHLPVHAPICVSDNGDTPSEQREVDADLRHVEGIGAGEISETINMSIESGVSSLRDIDTTLEMAREEGILEDQTSLADVFGYQDEL
jgi:hypothetical protein